MNYILPAIILLMIAALLVVITGFGLIAFNKKLHKKYSNKLMTLRVIIQATTITLLLTIVIYKVMS